MEKLNQVSSQGKSTARMLFTAAFMLICLLNLKLSFKETTKVGSIDLPTLSVGTAQAASSGCWWDFTIMNCHQGGIMACAPYMCTLE